MILFLRFEPINRRKPIVTLWYNQKGTIFNQIWPENWQILTLFFCEISHPSTVSLLLWHSISLAGWFISRQVRKVLASWLFYSTILTIGVRLIYRVSIYKHLVSYLMSYQSVHFWVLFFCTTFYTIFHRICITPLQIDFCSLCQRSLSS